MITRVKQKSTTFTNNSQLILGSLNNLDGSNPQTSSTQIDSLSIMSPVKLTQLNKGMISNGQNFVSVDNSPEITKLKRPRFTNNQINIFPELNLQQQKQPYGQEQNNEYQIGQNAISLKLQQSPLQQSQSPQKQQQSPVVLQSPYQLQTSPLKRSIQDINHELIANTVNNNNNNQQNSNQHNNKITSDSLLQTKKPSIIISSESSTNQQQGNDKVFHSILQGLDQETLRPKIRKKSENLQKSPLKKVSISELPSYNLTGKDTNSQQQSPLIQADKKVSDISQNVLSTENASPTLPEFYGRQLNSVRNSAQKWFIDQQPQNSIQMVASSSQNSKKLTSPIMTQSQPNNLQSVLNQNQQIKLPEILNINTPGRSGIISDNIPESTNHMMINSNGHQIPIVKQSLQTQGSYQTSIGTKSNINLRRDKIRFGSLVNPIPSNNNQPENVRDFLGLEKSPEEKQTVIKLSDEKQYNENGGAISVGRFKIRKTSYVPEEHQNQLLSPKLTILQIKSENQLTDDYNHSIPYLPNSPLISPLINQNKSKINGQVSMPFLRLNFKDQIINQENNQKNNNNNPNKNNSIDKGQHVKISSRKSNISTESEDTTKQEMIKLQQIWNFDNPSEEHKLQQNRQFQQNQQQRQQNQQQQYQQIQQLRQQMQHHRTQPYDQFQDQRESQVNQMIQSQTLKMQLQQDQQQDPIVLSHSMANQVYDGDNFGHYQYVRGAPLRSKGILKSKSPDAKLQMNQQNQESNFQTKQQNDNNKLDPEDITKQLNLKQRSQRKHNSMMNIRVVDNKNIYFEKKKSVNFKETLRVINLHKGTECLERLKKPLTGNVVLQK